MDYKPNIYIAKFIGMNYIWSIIGILLGMAINQFCIKIFKKFNIKSKITQINIQILVCSIILAIIHTNINNYFGWSWQNITPGLFFVSFFFSVQYNAFNNISLIFNDIGNDVFFY